MRHSHPNADDTRPSTPDLECWRQDLAVTRALAYIGVIATPRNDGTGWMYPRLTAWVLRKTWDGHHYCEPGHIVD